MDEVRCSNSCGALSKPDFDELLAIARLEHESRTWLIKLTNKLGSVISLAPGWIKKAISATLEPTLKIGNSVASRSHASDEPTGLIGKTASLASGEWFHKGVVTLTGATGGFFGAPGAIADVMASTTLVLRSIQEIATRYGEDLSSATALAECLTVLSMGGPGPEDDQLDESFWTTRAGLHAAINPATVGHVLASQQAQELAAKESVQRLLNSTAMQKVLERFAITTQAAFAQKAVPVVGAVAGAFVNYQFMAYYQRMAHVLYRLKRLEANYDNGQVRSCYEQIAKALRDKNTVRRQQS